MQFPVKTAHTDTFETELARSLAPEDLRRGDYVAILNEIREYPSFLWCLDTLLSPPHEPVRVQWSAEEVGTPLKVKAVCLPFVFVKAPCRVYRTLDMRQCKVVRLSRGYARLVWKALSSRRRKKSAAATALSLLQ